MTFEELLKQVKAVKGLEIRTVEKDYCEVVVAKAQLEVMLTVLNVYFGAPLKPGGQAVSKDAKHYSEPYGGVQNNQTLYHRKGDMGAEMALLWPWGSGMSVTVKIIREAEKLAPNKKS